MEMTKNSKEVQSMSPLASIIIVNYNGADLLRECLASLLKTEYSSFEIIMVDNNSSDNSIKLVNEEFPLCKVIRLPENKGFALGNNIGSTYAKGKYLVFLNNDTVVTPSWLGELIAAMEKDPDIAIAQSMLLKSNVNNEIDSSGDFATRFGRTYNSKRQGFHAPREILSARGAAMIVKKDIFEILGGFDEDFFISFEDVELGWKAWIYGYKVVMVPSSIVYHSGGSTMSKESGLMTYHGLKNQLSLITTHFETGLAIRNVTIVLISLFFGFIALMLKISIGRQNFTIDKKAAVKGVFWYFKNLPPIWRKHSLLNTIRKRSTKELTLLGLITKTMDKQ